MLCVGDLHVKAKTLKRSADLFAKILDTCREKKPRYVSLMGDTLHDHERINTSCLNIVSRFIDDLLLVCNVVIILVGNHDMVTPKEFLTDNHWLNVLKTKTNVYVIDRPTLFQDHDTSWAAVPFVPPGRFQDALDRLRAKVDLSKARFILAHQEFKGWSDYGPPAETGDDPDTDVFVISGHIHTKQRIKNVYYLGTPVQHGFGETMQPKTIMFIPDISDPKAFEEIRVDMPQFITLYTDELDTVDLSSYPDDKIRIVFRGNSFQCIEAQKSAVYKDLNTRKNIKVCFEVRNTDLVKKTTKIHTFREVFEQLLVETGLEERTQKKVRKVVFDV